MPHQDQLFTGETLRHEVQHPFRILHQASAGIIPTEKAQFSSCFGRVPMPNVVIRQYGIAMRF